MAVELTLPTISPQAMTLESVGPITLVLGSVLNIAPTITTNPTISGTAKVGETLTATAGDTTGTPPPTSTLQWQRSDNGTSGWSDISGATGTTYVLVSADETKYLRVEQTATNIEGSVTATSASTSQVKSAFSFLLDDYGGAAAAYSLRLLRSGYSGNAIRVRRSDDNEEQNIGFRNNELDTSTLETFSLGSDCFVVTWYDQSENGYNMTQSIASSQPKIVSSGSTLLLNSKPAIQSTTGNRMISSWTLAANLFSFMAVFEFTGTNSRLFTTDGSSSGVRNTAGNQLRARGTTDVTLISNATTQGQLLTSGFGTSSFSGYVNGNLGGSGNIGSYQSGSLQLGASAGLAGSVQEMIFYTTDESSDRTGIETNINDHYSIY